MFVVHTYRCHDCGAEQERMVERREADFQLCGECNSMGNMIRLPSATRTTFKFADKSGTKRSRE